MRYATVILDQNERAFHPIAHELDREPSIQRKAIHSIKLVDDDTIALLGEIEGDLDRYREIMQDSPVVEGFTVSGDESGYVYSHFEASEQTREMLEHREAGDFIIDMPIEYTEDSARKVTVIGTEESLLEMSEMIGVGETDIELVSMGPYSPESRGVFGDLTDRQREVLETALRLGYYENPRETTLDEIATELDISVGTVGQHVRSIESKVFEKYVP
ncbi:Predicted DNA binding protein, contains HTH domain [Halovenus aranensis]|jgi:predicted DNA binding protein|uniref:Predicted DNA binding protein, contains HTH domain n=1 Tax=Halovenus aranensis TaxID=890420 RepID=A0A1G8U9F2_9EURY|nr:helix-turn-helix domain-containing protein [Halovenus aranensis]SDJ50436.1 Predicted DNA binding protein, contains HTH domain [Halovenus aranensis]